MSGKTQSILMAVITVYCACYAVASLLSDALLFLYPSIALAGITVCEALALAGMWTSVITVFLLSHYTTDMNGGEK